MKKSILTILIVGLLALCAQATPAPDFSLIPSSGTVSGSPGATAGWGFTITNNDSSDWLVLNDSFFTPSNLLGSDGTYTDFIASQFVVIDPGSTSSESFDALLQSGVGSFQIPWSAPEGGTATGTVNVDYSLFSQDPNSPTFDPGSFVTAGTASAGGSVFVPEPSSALMLLGAAPLLIGTVRRKLWR